MSKDLHITISVNGRRHAFDLANQLIKRHCLDRLITSYPKFKAREWNIPNSYISSLLPTELFNRCRRYFPSPLKPTLNYLQNEWFDKWAAIRIPSTSNIFIGWSGNSLNCIRKAKSRETKTVLIRGSSHILYQKKIIEEEYESFGLPKPAFPEKIIEKELKEYSECDCLSIPSSFVKRTFSDYIKKDMRFIQVPYGVDLSHFKKIEKSDSVFRIITSGLLSLIKGGYYILRAIHELNLPNFEYWHLGTISPEMEQFVTKFKSPNIIFQGHKPQHELYKYYSQGSVFVMPSLEEGLSLVQPQAMSCGLPLICTTNTGGEDLITNEAEGFVIPIRDVDSLKEKILYLYENREICTQMGNAAMKKVTQGYSWNAYVEKLITEYKALLN